MIHQFGHGWAVREWSFDAQLGLVEEKEVYESIEEALEIIGRKYGHRIRVTKENNYGDINKGISKKDGRG